jgi:phytoene synthase
LKLELIMDILDSVAMSANQSAEMEIGTSVSLREAYRICERIATTHYENFPVGSRLAPGHLRPFLHAIYAFARTADDFADEGQLPPEERLRRLQDWGEKLDLAFQGIASSPVFVALADTIRRRNLPRQLFQDLLHAFRMDVTRNRYDTFEELQFYCRHSANPVGRLVLRVFGIVSETQDTLSDRICTALQLTNFWQDLSRDLQRGRIYLPLEDLDRFGYTVADLQNGLQNDRFRLLMLFEIERTRALFESAGNLPASVGGRLGLELGLTRRGGMMILRKIEESDYNVLFSRPKITGWDKVRMMLTI